MYFGWIVCGSFVVIYTLCQGILFSYSEMVVHLKKEMEIGLSILNWLGALPSCFPMLLTPIATVLNFRIGTRKTVYIGVVLATASLLTTAFINDIVLMFLVYGIGTGSGITLIINPPFYLIGEYFPYDHPRHVLATSVIACAFPLATLIFNPLTYLLIENIGWRQTYFVYGAAMLVIGSATALSFIPISAQNDSDDNQNEYTDILSNTKIPRTTKHFMFTIWFIASVAKSIGYYTPLFILVDQMVSNNVAQSKAAIVMSLYGAVELVSRLVASYIGDFFKGRLLYAYVFSSFVLVLVNVFGAFADSIVHWVIYVIALGLFGGPIIAAMYSSCSEVLSCKEVPTLFTLFRVGLGVGIITGPSMSGVFTDATNSYRWTYFMMSLTYLTACGCYAAIIYINRYQPNCLFRQTIKTGDTCSQNGDLELSYLEYDTLRHCSNHSEEHRN